MQSTVSQVASAYDKLFHLTKYKYFWKCLGTASAQHGQNQGASPAGTTGSGGVRQYMCHAWGQLSHKSITWSSSKRRQPWHEVVSWPGPDRDTVTRDEGAIACYTDVTTNKKKKRTNHVHWIQRRMYHRCTWRMKGRRMWLLMCNSWFCLRCGL